MRTAAYIQQIKQSNSSNPELNKSVNKTLITFLAKVLVKLVSSLY